MKKEFSAGVIIFYISPNQEPAQRQYLVLHYPKGHWDLPKGKLEGDETQLQAALREVKEETGLTVTVFPGFEQGLSYIFKDQSGQLINKQVVFFVGQAHTQQVVLSPEHIEYQWLPLKDALKQVTYINAQQLLSMADEFLQHLR